MTCARYASPSDEPSPSRSERVQPGKSHLRLNDLHKHIGVPHPLQWSCWPAMRFSYSRSGLSRRPAHESVRRSDVPSTRPKDVISRAGRKEARHGVSQTNAPEAAAPVCGRGRGPGVRRPANRVRRLAAEGRIWSRRRSAREGDDILRSMQPRSFIFLEQLQAELRIFSRSGNLDRQ